MKHKLVPTLLMSALALSACGANGVEEHAFANDAPAHAEATKRWHLPTGAFKTYDQPIDAALDATFTLLGTIESVADGPVLETTYPSGARELDHYVVVKVKVTEILAGSDSAFESGFAYLTRPRGVESLGADGKPLGADATTSVADIAEALPVGTKALVMASKAPTAKYLDMSLIATGALPPNVVELSMYNPQSLFLDSPTESPLSGWQNSGVTFGEGVEGVRRGLSLTKGLAAGLG